MRREFFCVLVSTQLHILVFASYLMHTHTSQITCASWNDGKRTHSPRRWAPPLCRRARSGLKCRTLQHVHRRRNYASAALDETQSDLDATQSMLSVLHSLLIYCMMLSAYSTKLCKSACVCYRTKWLSREGMERVWPIFPWQFNYCW